MSQEDQNPILQFSYDKKIIQYKGRSVFLSQEECDEFISSLPDIISTQNDKLKIFSYYDDNFYHAEKTKQYYDFRSKSKVDRWYVPELSQEHAQIIKSNLETIYDSARLNFLQKQKDEIRDRIDQGFSIVSTSLRALRDDLLKKSDWTQIEDNPLSEDVKYLWRQFRQYLRDITESSNWETLNALEVNFPIDPNNYLLKYPNREVEYLSTEDQFENQIAKRVKAKLLGFIDYLNFVEENTPNDEINIKDPLANYVNLTDYINKKLSKIDPNLKITIAYNRISDYTVPENLSGMTPEMISLISDMITDPSKASRFTIDELNSLSTYVQAYKDFYDKLS